VYSLGFGVWGFVSGSQYAKMKAEPFGLCVFGFGLPAFAFHSIIIVSIPDSYQDTASLY